MKHLSISLPAFTLALALTLSGATPKSDLKTPAPSVTKASNPIASCDIMYYWFTYPEDQFNDWDDVSDEEFEWWMLLGGVPVDQNPVGGTLIARGYMNNSDPHTGFPTAFLYAHYVY